MIKLTHTNNLKTIVKTSNDDITAQTQRQKKKQTATMHEQHK